MSLSLLKATFHFILIITTIYQVRSQNISIIRKEKDVFTNQFRCQFAKAVCFDKNCTYCQCQGENETFVQTRRYGECVPNEYLAYVTAYNLSFLAQDTMKKLCLFDYKHPWDSYIIYVRAKLRCDINAISQRWLWTINGQLFNLDRLKCITVGWKIKNYHILVLKQCNSNDKKQLWKCDRNDPYYVWQQHSNGYLHYGDHGDYVTSHVMKTTALKWKRLDSNQTLCSEAVGCETFQDGSSLVVLNQTINCHENSKCWGKKEVSIARKVTECRLLPDQTQYLHKDGWQKLLIKTGSFDVVTNGNKTSLKWDLTKTPKSWKGLIVKVQFRCKAGGEDQYKKKIHCVLIKYMGLFTGFHKSEQFDNETDGKTQTTVVIVCVLIITFVMGIVGFLAYRNKSRLIKMIRRATEKPADEIRHVSPGQRSGDSNNPIYHSNHSAQNDCQLYETTEPEHVYHYANAGQEIEAQPPPKLTYDYAVAEDRPRISQQTGVRNLTQEKKKPQNAPELNNSNNTPHLYHVLEN